MFPILGILLQHCVPIISKNQKWLSLNSFKIRHDFKCKLTCKQIFVIIFLLSCWLTEQKAMKKLESWSCVYIFMCSLYKTISSSEPTSLANGSHKV